MDYRGDVRSVEVVGVLSESPGIRHFPDFRVRFGVVDEQPKVVVVRDEYGVPAVRAGADPFSVVQFQEGLAGRTFVSVAPPVAESTLSTIPVRGPERDSRAILVHIYLHRQVFI